MIELASYNYVLYICIYIARFFLIVCVRDNLNINTIKIN